MTSRQPQTNDDIDRVRAASDIADVVGEVVHLRPKGREYVGLCPFHDDRNPSMYVVPSKQIFHCFVCGAGGDVFGFTKRYHSMEFGDALRFLAERANIELTPLRTGGGTGGGGGGHGTGPGQSGAGKGARESVMRANADGMAFYRALLAHPEHGKAGRDIIDARGISEEMVEAFAIGVSPDRWDGLAMLVEQKQWDQAAFVRAGLLKERESGGVYDALRHRLIFPILNQASKPIAFGGRRIRDEDDPKYLNSPDTPVFDKSSTLYGLHRAQQSIRKRKSAVVVEGYTDVIACHQHGHDNVVATLGTALTPGHARVLKRLCETVVLLFDGDEAGQRAADRALDVFLAEPVDVKIASLASVTDAKDPDELLAREGGSALLARAFDEARLLLRVVFEGVGEKLRGAGPAQRAGVIEEMLRRLRDAGLERVSPVRRGEILRELSGVTSVDEQTLRATLASLSGARPAARNDEASRGGAHDDRAASSPAHTALGCLLADASLWAGLSLDERDALGVDAFGDAPSMAVADALHRLREDGEACDLSGVLRDLELEDELPGGATVEAAASRATALADQARRMVDGDRERLATMLRDCVRATMSRRRAPRISEGGGEHGPAETHEQGPGTAAGTQTGAGEGPADDLAKRLAEVKARLANDGRGRPRLVSE
ncbi:MAG: DNA primase [Planctomycetota bacterium]